MLEDIAVLTNGNVIAEEVGLSLEKATLDDLGSAKRVTISKENTIIIDGGGDSSKIKGRIDQIQAQIEEASSDYDKEKVTGTDGQARRRCRRHQSWRGYRS